MTEEQIKHIFSHHPPTPERAEVHDEVNKLFVEFALKLNTLMPPGPGHAVAIRKLSDARNAANQAIALEGEF